LKKIKGIAREVNVHYVLEGSVRRAANELRIVAQLIDVSDGYHIWSEQYDRVMQDIFAIQDEITQMLVIPWIHIIALGETTVISNTSKHRHAVSYKLQKNKEV